MTENKVWTHVNILVLSEKIHLIPVSIRGGLHIMTLKSKKLTFHPNRSILAKLMAAT